MIPPSGFKAEMYPLRHRFQYSAGLSAVTGSMNSTMFSLVRNYKGSNPTNAIEVNPHNSAFLVETGSICGKMSIIDKLKLTLMFNLTNNSTTDRSETSSGTFTGDGIQSLKLQWFPIFFSFKEKLLATDEVTTTSVGSILELTNDATQEDITPAYGNKLPVLGASDKTCPVSTVNLTETKEILNITTDLTMEAVPFNMTTLFSALKYYTNKGALKASMGQIRTVVLTKSNPHRTVHIEKFVPRSIRRIMPYTFMGIMVHVPIVTDPEQHYMSQTLTASIAHVGVKCFVNYDEWNPEHVQEMET